jgi:glycosyltransferase involved in cell wall biosynthesis
VTTKPLRVVHCPVNMGSIGWTNVQTLRRKGVDARLVLFEPRALRPYEVDVTLNLPPLPAADGRPVWTHVPFWERQAKQLAALARFLPTTDVFHFYFGLTLVPKAIQFPALRAFGRKSVFHFLGSDIRRKTREELAYAWRADARIVGSYDAKRWVPDAHVVPVGIDLSRYEPVPARDADRLRIVHAPTNRRAKATDAVIAACAQLPVELDIVENVRHDQAIERFKQADIVVDQFNAGWHGVFAIEGMALAKPVVGYIRDEPRELSAEAFGVELPIWNATKETLAERLRPLVASVEERRRLGQAGRAYVEQVHDAGNVADRLLSIYRSL